MKKIILILSLLLTFPITALYGQSENEQDISEKIREIEIHNQYSIRLKQISESEYTARKNETEHLRHKPYKVITDISEVKKMLDKRKIHGKKIKITEYGIREYIESDKQDESTGEMLWEGDFVAYYPEVHTLLFYCGAGIDRPFDLNETEFDGAKSESLTGNPEYHAVSLDKKFRINGYVEMEPVKYFLEKWNPKKKKFEFVYFFNKSENAYSVFDYAGGWFWTSNSKVLFRYGWSESYQYYEMEIIKK